MTQLTPVPFMAAPMPAPMLSGEVDGLRLVRAGKTLLNALSRGRALDAALIRSAMTEAFGASDSSGAWVWKDAYEAVEVAQVMFLCRFLPAMRKKASTSHELELMLIKLGKLLPTHTKRSEDSVQLQQFSTPMALATLVAEAAAMTPQDLVLEPSAGTGQLALHAALSGAKLVLNEWADNRRVILEELFPDAQVLDLNAEYIHDMAPDGFAPSVVIMNPPFSASPHVSGGMAGTDLRHLRSALRLLAPGGRLVAITSQGLAPDNPTYRDAFADLASIATLRLTCKLGRGLFAAHGTNIPTRLTVFDKTPGAPMLTAVRPEECMNVEAALGMVRDHVPERLHALPVFGVVLGDRVAASPVPVPPTSCKAAREAEGVEVSYTLVPDARPCVTSGDALYEAYSPERISILGAQPHPTTLVQSAAMSSVLPPAPTYRPHLPEAVVRDGLLSAPQLESVIYAGESHSKHLAGAWAVNETLDMLDAAREGDSGAVKFRRGWFLGDGTGAGKGRQAAGIVLDNWLKGRRKALWISKSDKLLEDAQRDWSALGQERLLVVPQSRFRQGKPIKLDEGILFTTYATLRSGEREGKASRLKQILDWLGDDFDGAVILDESHAMGNAAGSSSERGAQKGSQQGIAGLKLQHALPDARVVYVSATGATSVENLAYAQRLGLWGSDDLPFESRAAFVTAMHAGGIAASEVLARDLKSLGLYAARSLSYDGVEVELLEHQLTPGQIAIYDEYASAYQIIHHHLDAAMEASGVTKAGVTQNKVAKTAARSAFEGSKQRFFNHLITAMKMPTLIRSIEADRQAGLASVVQLVSTSEALMERRLSELPASEWGDLSFDVTPREYVLDYLKHSFPTVLYESYTDGNGDIQTRPVLDKNGHSVECREAVAKRDTLIERLGALPPVQAALDQMIHHFGTDAVAEVTGRSRRIIKKVTATGAKLMVQNRPTSSNLGEAQAFMDDVKHILVFSDAGGTGRSYHADLGCKNQRQRNHYLLEGGWKADAAIQGLGRTNRTNQKQPPLFRPLSTDVRGEKRFISTIARRLDSLGAITRGQRQTGGQGMFKPSDNLESMYARDALRQFYRLLHKGKIKCCSLKSFVDMTGLRLLDQDGTLLEDLPPIHTFLNRVLALQIHVQNALFEEFEAILEGRIESAIAAGTYEAGLETLTAVSMTVVNRSTVNTHAASGAITELLEVRQKERNTPLTLAAVIARVSEGEAVKLINEKSGRAALQVKAPSLTLEDGTSEKRFRLLRPMESFTMAAAAMEDTHWYPCSAAAFDDAWSKEVSEVPEFRDVTFHVMTGLLLPIWKLMNADNPRVYRFTTDDGAQYIGRLIAPESVAMFQPEATRVLTSEDGWSKLRAGQVLSLGRDLAVRPAKVMYQQRYELTGFEVDELPRLKALGLYSEIIAYRTRLFVPPDNHDVLQALLDRYMPVAA